VQGVRYDTIRAGLLSFFPSPTMTPGRLNMIRVGGARVLVDYGHNSAAVQGLMDLTRALQARRRVGVIGGPGDRRDDDLRQLGRIVAPVLDRVIVREDADPRGRAPGEVAELIRQGLIEAGFPEERAETVIDEADAVERALGMLEDGDLAVIFVDDVHGVLAQVQRDGSTAAL
jgi:cyanophycin synthetase